MASRRRVGRKNDENSGLLSSNEADYGSVSNTSETRNVNVHEDDVIEELDLIEELDSNEVESERRGSNDDYVHEQARPTFAYIPSTLCTSDKHDDNCRRVEKGHLDLIRLDINSLDYDVCINKLSLEAEENLKGDLMVFIKRWVVLSLIGFCTGVIAGIIDIVVDQLSSLKYSTLKKQVDECMKKDDQCLGWSAILWQMMNILPTLIAASLTVFVEPVAVGSGISQIKSYLNGINIPRIVRLKTMFIKCVGVTMAVVGGLAVGKEGPMIHTGAVIAAGISQGKSTTLKRDLKIFKENRNDHDKRDFVAAGASAGVAAAFGAPIGGMLFGLEEGVSFWNQVLSIRLLYCSMISTISLNMVLRAYRGGLFQLSYGALLNFGQFENITYSFFEIPLFILMGVIGGLLGALFVALNVRLNQFRLKYMYKDYLKVLEACVVAMITASIGISMILLLNDCKWLGTDPNKNPVQIYCGDGQYNALAAIWFQTPEESVRSLFHDPPGSHQILSLFCVALCFYLLSCWTYGLSIPSGLFIPALLTGAAWGRIAGIQLQRLYPNAAWSNPGKYALFGAAAQLSGVVRMTISLTVILIEATGVSNFGLPLIIIVQTAKYVADCFNMGIYDVHIRLQKLPFLASEPPLRSSYISAKDIMKKPVVTLRKVENVGHINGIFKLVKHNGFPIVENTSMTDGVNTFGRLLGIMLRTDILTLQHLKAYCDTEEGHETKPLSLEMIRNCYPRQLPLDQVNVAEGERDSYINFSRYMCESPYVVNEHATLPRVFRLFRGVGLRHVIVVNEYNEVTGMITRKDLARYYRVGEKIKEFESCQG